MGIITNPGSNLLPDAVAHYGIHSRLNASS